MNVPATLTQYLSALSDALGDTGDDLNAILSVLLDDLTDTIPGFLGLTITVIVDGRPVSISTLTEATVAAVQASISWPLTAIADTAPDSTATFFAAAPHAFRELAADLRRIFNRDGHIQLDSHLPPTDLPPAVGQHFTCVHEWSICNQAIGVLLARGATPQEAHAALQHRSHTQRITLTDAAREVLDDPTVIA